MCARKCGRRAFATIRIRLVVVLVCDTCIAELYRAGLIDSHGRPESN